MISLAYEAHTNFSTSFRLAVAAGVEARQHSTHLQLARLTGDHPETASHPQQEPQRKNAQVVQQLPAQHGESALHPPPQQLSVVAAPQAVPDQQTYDTAFALPVTPVSHDSKQQCTTALPKQLLATGDSEQPVVDVVCDATDVQDAIWEQSAQGWRALVSAAGQGDTAALLAYGRELMSGNQFTPADHHLARQLLQQVSSG